MREECFGRFMTRIAVCGQRRELAVLVMTREAGCVSYWPRLESSFLQPECITDIFRRLGHELIIRFVLRFVCLVAVGAIGV